MIPPDMDPNYFVLIILSKYLYPVHYAPKSFCRNNFVAKFLQHSCYGGSSLIYSSQLLPIQN